MPGKYDISDPDRVNLCGEERRRGRDQASPSSTG